MPFHKESLKARWISARLVDWAPVLVVLVAYALLRAGVVVGVLSRGGLPASALGWSGAASGITAAGQAITVATMLAVVRWRKPAAAWTAVTLGVSAAAIDATLWVALGNAAAPAGYAWQVVLAVVFAVATTILCRSAFAWTRRGWDSFDLQRISRALCRVTGSAVAASAATGFAALAVNEPAALDRLLRFTAFAALATSISAIVVWLPIVGEQRRKEREAAVDEMYRHINESWRSKNR